MSTRRASAHAAVVCRPVPDSLRAVGALSAAAALRARRSSHRARRTIDLLSVVGVLTFALLLVTAGPATARASQSAPAPTTTTGQPAAQPTGDPTVLAAGDPAAPTSDPATAPEDPAAPSADPAAPTSDPVAGEDPETAAQPEYPPPTVRACAPCYERRPPAPTRLGASAAPAVESGGSGPGAAARPQAPPRPAAAFQLPATGSSIPTIAVAGVILLALGLVLRTATRGELTR